MNAGLTLVRHPPVSAIATATLDDKPPTAIWNDLVQSGTFLRAIERAIRNSATGQSAIEFRDYLEAFDLPRGLDELAVRMAKGELRAAFLFANAIKTLGEGRSPIEDTYSVLALLEGAEHPPTITLNLEAEFFERRRDQRESICELIALLARTCDVRIVGGGVGHRKLAEKHREQLPGVSESCNTHRDLPPTEAVVETARSEFDPDGRQVRILRELANTPAETLSYHELNSVLPFDSDVRYYVADLYNHDLVEKFRTSEGTHVELLTTGSTFLDTLDQDIGQQAKLDQRVMDSGKSCKYSRVSTPSHENPPEEEGPAATAHADRRRLGTVVTPTYMPRWRHDAVRSAASDGEISLVDHPEPTSDETRQPYLSHEDDTLVVAAEYMNPMQWWVSIARALTDRRIFDHVLTPDRLDGDIGSLSGLLTDDTRLLRDARCLGWLKDADADAENFAQALMAGEDELTDRLRRLSNDDYDCSEKEFRRRITKHAHGLAGTVAHLCDLAGVDLVRELRLGESNRRFDAKRREDLCKTLVTGAQISSRHGHFAAYRQLFEARDDKRAAALTPSIPADKPTGGLIGSFVLTGKNIDRLSTQLDEEFTNGNDLHDDAPEFDVHVPVRTDLGRSEVAQAVRSALERKRLSATRVSVALFDGIAGSVYDVAHAIWNSLSTEDRPREIRLDEVRRVLAHLPANRLLPDMQPTIQKLTKALLTVDVPLTQSELAERADVSARSARTHLPKLEALGLADVSDAGIRFALPFTTSEERGADIVPGLATESGPVLVDVAYELVQVISGDAAHDFETPVGAAFFGDGWADALSQLRLYERWVALLERLSHHGLAAETTPVRFGTQPEQAAITEVVT